LLLLIKLKVVVARTPLIVLDRVMVLVVLALVVVLEEMTDEVADTPFTVVVSVFPEREVVNELIILVNKVDTPFTMLAKVLVVVESVFVFTKLAVVVAILPLTLLVNRKLFVVVETDNKLLVEEAINPDNEVVEVTPLVEIIKLEPDVVAVLLVIIVEVAITPLTVEVKVLPAAD
jgi:hypothetical protein